MVIRRATRHHNCQAALGLFIGIVLGFFITARIRTYVMSGSLAFGCKVAQRSRSIYSNPSSSDVPTGILGEDDESNGRNLIFVGVMTAQKYLDTRAVSVFETWGKNLPGRIAFFSSASSETEYDIPLIPLPGVDDTYPPQKKSFLMLKYMHDHFIDKFEWFMRADDDVFIRGDKLETFLRSINSSTPQFIGQAGTGNKEEFGQLSLEDDENFCMGGPGMIFSRETLKRVVPKIKFCLKNMFSIHEDVEVGRCIRNFAGIPCTWSYEMQNIFYHNSSGREAFTGRLKQKEVHRAITLHPVKQHKHLFRINNYFLGLKIQQLYHQSLLLLRDIRDINLQLHESSQPSVLKFGNPDILGKGPSLNKFLPTNHSEVIIWDFFSRTVFSDKNTNPKRRIESHLKEAVEDIITEVMEMINKFSQQRGRVIDFKEILYGYKRVVPLFGADYILDLLLVYKKYRGKKMTVPVRRHAYLQQAFTELQLNEIFDGLSVKKPKTDLFNILDMVQQKFDQFNSVQLQETTTHELVNIKDKVIHFILPLSDRFSTFTRFITNFKEVCLENDEAVKLVVVLFRGNDSSDFDNTIALMEELKRKYFHYDLKVLVAQNPFSRALALELGASQYEADSLLFCVDVDIVFTQGFLERVRLNTILNRQVYYPIVFSQYDPSIVSGDNYEMSPDTLAITQDTGYWRQFGFGIVTIYKSDLVAVGGFDTSIQGWGREDVDLYDKVVQSNLTIFRAADIGLIHVFHSIECSSNLIASQYDMCIGTRASSYGSIHKLAKLIYKDFL